MLWVIGVSGLRVHGSGFRFTLGLGLQTYKVRARAPRPKSPRKAISYIIDVWPGIPSTGLGVPRHEHGETEGLPGPWASRFSAGLRFCNSNLGHKGFEIRGFRVLGLSEDNRQL